MTITKSEYPRIISFLTKTRLQKIFILVALGIILTFDASVFIFRPYDGLVFDDYDFTVVTSVDKGSPAEKAGVLPGDKFLTVGYKPVDQWLARPMYKLGIKAGDTVAYRVERNGQSLTLIATVGGFFDKAAFFGPILGLQFLSVAFWLIGLFLCVFVASDDTRARLAGLVWLLMGIAVASGGPAGASYFWGSGTTMKISWAVIGFLLVALHLYFPAPTITVPSRKRIVWLFGVISVVVIAVTIVDDTVFKTHFSTYTGLNYLVYGFFLISVLVSLWLLLSSYFKAGDLNVRRQTRIVLWGMVLGIVPFLALTLLPILLGLAYFDGAYTTLFLILIPLSYAYVFYQRKLLKVDFLINRLVVFFVMGLLILIVSFLTLMVAAALMNLPSLVPIIGSVVAVLVALPSSSFHDRANRWVSRTLYGAYYDHASVTGGLSNRLAQALDRITLVSLLTDDLAKQMGIQQTALLLADGDNLSLWQHAGDDVFVISLEDELCRFLLTAQAPVRTQNLGELLSGNIQERWRRFSWGEVFAPVIFENRLYGILILGKRVAGNIYSDQDMHIIATVTQQGALAMDNVQLVETLRRLSQQLVRADENERKQVARELHDGVLQNLFFIRQKVRQNPELVGYLEDIITTLRRTIKAQRPSELDRGLAPALEDLVSDMKKLVGANGPKIVWRGTAGDIRLPDEQATAIYRIAQESVSNAVRHAQAQNIAVSLSRDEGILVLAIEDDGVGMPQIRASEGQYGLIGVRERAIMIGAVLRTLSNQGEGTRIVMEYKLQ